MELLNRKKEFDFVGRAKVGFIISAIAIALTVASLIARGGPNYGIDFKGGMLAHLKFSPERDIASIRSDLDSLGLGDYTVQYFGSRTDVVINVELRDETVESGAAESVALERSLRDLYGAGVSLERLERVGPKVGHDLRWRAFLAALYALIGILIYITFRFEFRYGIAAIVALAHDTTITIGAFSIMDKEFTLATIAALLTVIGYSLNDTIVVFDRIRENKRLKRALNFERIVNLSINATLSRTLLTSGTTLIVTLALFIFGGAVIHDFAFALLVGVIVGTYSSIFIAAPILIALNERITRRARYQENFKRAES